ncbi:hypothetical protein [Bradyrhizobium manausense]
MAFLITPGNTHDLVGARDLIGMIRNPRRLLADRKRRSQATALRA